MKGMSLKLPLLMVVLFLATGCAINRTSATFAPGTDLGKVKHMYVVQAPNDKHGVYKLLSGRLMKMGYTITVGPEMPAASYNTDLVVTYQDKWVWDITMYMLELTVYFRNPGNGYPVASGNSFHTSLTRKSSDEMVEEVLTSIFTKAKQGS